MASNASFWSVGRLRIIVWSRRALGVWRRRALDDDRADVLQSLRFFSDGDRARWLVVGRCCWLVHNDDRGGRDVDRLIRERRRRVSIGGVIRCGNRPLEVARR